MIFTINTENNISAFASAKDIDNPETIQQFKTLKELNKFAIDWPSGRLVEIWNSLPGVQPVKKFRSRDTAISRIWTAIQGLGATIPPPPPAQTPAVATVTASAKKEATANDKPAVAREGSRKSLVIGMLEKLDGASLAEIMEATGWQSHSVRGFISGSLVKKSGLKVDSFKRGDGQRAYAIR